MLDSEDTPIDQLPLNTVVHLLAHNVDGLLAVQNPFGPISPPNDPGDNTRSLLDARDDYDEE